jgi:6-pyruvoyltetrahydropterin/6-carboxytetrahydropterin synthase
MKLRGSTWNILVNKMAEKVSVFRLEHFNAAHRLYNGAWSDQQNADVFGKCSLPHYHGHNYELEIKVTGEIDERTGFVMDMKKLSDLVQEVVVEKFDHKNLNLDTEEFRELNPTAENIAVVIYKLLRPHIDNSLDLKLRLYETPRNYVEYPA